MSLGTCSADEKIGDLCFDGTVPNSNDFEEYLGNGQSIFMFYLMSSQGNKPDTSMLEIIKEKSKWLIQNIDKNPIAAGTVGLGISILLLYDSLADDSTKNVIQEYADLLKTPASDFATNQAYNKYIFKQTNRIHRRVIELKSQKLGRVIMKAIFACIYGWIGWATTNVVLRPLAYIASLLGFIPGTMDAYRYIELNNLAKAFQKTGYIV